MDELTWTFEAGGIYGVRACAAGFEAYGQGIEVEAVHTFTDDGVNLTNGGGYTYTTAIEPTVATRQGMVMVHVVFSASVNLSASNLSGTYGGLPLVFSGASANVTDLRVIEAIGYVHIGDSDTIANFDLSISLSGVSNPNIVSGSVEAVFVDGILDAAPEFFAAGTVDVFAASLVIDPEPTDPDVVFSYVFTGAAQGDIGGVGTLVLTGTNYEQIGTTLGGVNTLSGIGSLGCITSYDCDCDVDPDARTLLDMRIDTLSVSGYAANATNPGPGINRMYNKFLELAQEYVYSKFRAMSTARFFTWTLAPNVRYYGLADTTNCCNVLLNRYRIEGAWIQDLNNTWTPLVYGIDPESYTLDANNGYPTNFEVRQCVEIFPAPQAAYRLRIKGHYQLLPLTDDADTSTLPSTPILNYAIFLAKSHKGMKDANIYSAMADSQIDAMIYGRHATRRYIPGGTEFFAPARPTMTAFDDA